MDVLVGKITTKTVDGRCIVENAGLKYLDKLNLIGTKPTVNDFINLCFENCKKNSIIYMLDLKLQASVIIHSLVEMTAIQFIPAELYYFDDSYDYRNCINKPSNLNDFFKSCNDGIYYNCTVGELGEWYSLEVWSKYNGEVKNITFRDFSKIFVGVDYEKLAVNFLDIPYNKNVSGIEALKRDLFVLGRSVKICREDWGITETTAASAAFSEFKETLCKTFLSSKATKSKKEEVFRSIYPSLKNDLIEFCYSSYRGGFIYSSESECYKNKKIFSDDTRINGVLLDINSLYPYVMRTKPLPVGQGQRLQLDDYYEFDNEIEELLKDWCNFNKNEFSNEKYEDFRVLRFCCSFELKEDGLPFVMLKNYELSSDFNRESGASRLKADTTLKTSNKLIVEMTMNNIDLELFYKNYNIKDLTFIEGYSFRTESGLFDSYIDFWYNKKSEARKSGNKIESEVSKLMLNSLSGKFGAKLKKRWKVPVIEEGVVNYRFTSRSPSSVVYMPVASAITAWGREVLFDYIVKLKEILRKKYGNGFDPLLYSDTDSIHLVLREEDLKLIQDFIGLDLGKLKIEKYIYQAKYVRSKVYLLKVENSELKVSCSGLPKESQDILTFENLNSETVFEGAKSIKVEGKGGVIEIKENFRIKGV